MRQGDFAGARWRDEILGDKFTNSLEYLVVGCLCGLEDIAQAVGKVAPPLVEFSNCKLDAIDWLYIGVFGSDRVEKAGDIPLGGVELLRNEDDLTREIRVYSRRSAVQNRFPCDTVRFWRVEDRPEAKPDSNSRCSC